jgi:hypothetical protein
MQKAAPIERNYISQKRLQREQMPKKRAAGLETGSGVAIFNSASS